MASIPYPAATEPFQPAPAPSGDAMSGPMTEQLLRQLRARNEHKHAAAVHWLGDRWLLHPSRRLR